MEQHYSGAMSEEMQKYSLWEQDYYSQGQGLTSEAASTNFINNGGKHISIINLESDNEDVARNASSPDAGKQKRRRSKGAAAQSTTFVKASISNFRAVVQQHTGWGCHNTNSSPKGPITLCFAPGPAPSTHINNQYYSYS